jgi:hypothetical protein
MPRAAVCFFILLTNNSFLPVPEIGLTRYIIFLGFILPLLLVAWLSLKTVPACNINNLAAVKVL